MVWSDIANWPNEQKQKTGKKICNCQIDNPHFNIWKKPQKHRGKWELWTCASWACEGRWRTCRRSARRRGHRGRWVDCSDPAAELQGSPPTQSGSRSLIGTIGPEGNLPRLSCWKVCFPAERRCCWPARFPCLSWTMQRKARSRYLIKILVREGRRVTIMTWQDYPWIRHYLNETNWIRLNVYTRNKKFANMKTSL